ncbi:MAG: phytanoyl-CoA dioxygenase family protein [Pseudomonadales bacterium]
MYHLTTEEQASWLEDGFLVRAGMFTPAEVEALRDAAIAAEQAAVERSRAGKTYFLDGKRFVDEGYLTVQFEHHDPATDLVRVIEPVHELHPRFDELIDDHRLVAPMQDILQQSSLALWTAKLNLKPGKVGSGFGWHQDSPYWVHDSDHVDMLPNVMLTFDDATLENGCFQVIRGSHREGCLPGTADGTQLGGFFTDPTRFDEADAVPMVVPAGSLIFFSAHSVHGSGVNRTDQPRRAIILTYQPGGFPALKSGQIRPVRCVPQTGSGYA